MSEPPWLRPHSYRALYKYCQSIEEELTYVLHEWLPRHVSSFAPLALESVPVVQEHNGQIGDYRIGEELGKGTFGRVFAATDGRSGAAVAVKMMPKVNQTKQHPSIHSTTLVSWTLYVRLSVVRVAG